VRGHALNRIERAQEIPGGIIHANRKKVADGPLVALFQYHEATSLDSGIIEIHCGGHKICEAHVGDKPSAWAYPKGF